MQGSELLLEQLADTNKAPPGSDPMIDTLRSTFAERFKDAARRFVEQQVRDAKGSWGV